jgi:hypothetical protein
MYSIAIYYTDIPSIRNKIDQLPDDYQGYLILNNKSIDWWTDSGYRLMLNWDLPVSLEEFLDDVRNIYLGNFEFKQTWGDK